MIPTTEPRLTQHDLDYAYDHGLRDGKMLAVADRDRVLEDVIILLLSSVHPQSNCSKVLREILKNNRLMAELRTPAPEDEFRCKQCGQFSEECECEESPAPEQP